MQKLTGLKAAEVSLVPQGANRRRFIIWKSADGDKKMNTHEELQKAIAAADPEVMKRVGDFLDKSVMKDDANAGVIRTAAQAISRIASSVKDKLSPETMHKLIDAVGFQVTPDGVGEGDRGGAGAMSVGQAPSVGGGEVGKEFQALPADVLEKMKTMDGKGQKEHLEKLGLKYEATQPAMKTKSGEPADKTKKEEEEVEKSAKLDAETQSKLDAVFKAHEAITQENKELKAELAALQMVNKRRELVAKAASWSHLGLPQEQLVTVLEDAQKAGPEAFERISKMFDAQNEQTRVAKSFGGSLFREMGSSQSGGVAGGDTTWSRIEKAADAHVAKDASFGSLTKEQRVAKFLETSEGMALYQEHQASRKDGI